MCGFPEKPGKEVLESILASDQKGEDRMKVYQNVLKLLSAEKTTFNGENYLAEDETCQGRS